ncbi:MAG: SNF2-related protein [Lachnospiraceae bacterium]|nr:SNF2-related protein [Lachnospiraceae bacterium]
MQIDEKLKTIYETIAPTITRSEEAWKDYLRFGSNIYKYSFDNALLVYAQKPKATMLATFEIWKSPKVNRSINKGEKGVAVCEYYNAKLSVKHLFDVTQTNGAKIPDIWKLEAKNRTKLLNRLSGNHNISAHSLIDLIDQMVERKCSDIIESHLKGFEDDIKDHFLGTIPQGGLIAELFETIKNSCAYYIASRCGLSVEVNMPTISHFDTIALISRLGYTVTEISKGILLEIARNVKLIESERSDENEQRIIGKQGTTSINSEPGDRGRTGRDPRKVRPNGDESSLRNRPAKVFTFEDARRAYEPDEPGGQRSNGESDDALRSDATKRLASEHRRHYGTDEASKQPPGYSGGISDKRDGADTQVIESEIEKQPEIEPLTNGSFSMPIDNEQIIKADLLRGSMTQGGKSRIYNFIKFNPTGSGFAKFLKDEYGWGGHSGYENDILSVDYRSSGIEFRIRDNNSENGERLIKLNWNNVAKRITELVNNGEYLPDEEAALSNESDEFVLTDESYKPENSDESQGIKNSDESKELKERVSSLYFQQYNDLLRDYPNSVIFKRLGDFYEVMGADAQKVADEMGFQLTSRDKGLEKRVPLLGVAAHIIDTVVKELTNRNYSIVIADDESVKEYTPIAENASSDDVTLDDYAILGEPESYSKSGGSKEEQLTLFDIGLNTDIPTPPPKVKAKQGVVYQNYQLFAGLFPKIIDGTYRYLHLESEGCEPLSVERLDGNRNYLLISIMHTFVQNGDLMRDPDMVIEINLDEQTVNSKSYELSSIGSYKDVNAGDTPNLKLQRELNSFLTTWLENIGEQGFTPVKAILHEADEDIEIVFDSQGNPVISAQEIESHLNDKADVLSESENPIATSVFDERESPSNVPIDNAKEPIRLYSELLNAHHGQKDMQIQAFYGDDIVGILFYSVFQDSPRIENIEVGENFRRQGIATAMVKYLAGEYPDTEIKWTLLTKDGQAFHDAVTYEVENEEHTEVMVRLSKIEKQLEHYNTAYNEGSAAIPDDINELWNTLQDEQDELVRRLPDLFPVKTFIRLDDELEKVTVPDITDEHNNSGKAYEADGSGGMVDDAIAATNQSLKMLPPSPPAQEIVNYRYFEEDNLFTGGAKTKFRNNIEAIRLLKHLENERHFATSAEQKVLANYVGWGGLSNAFSNTAAGWENEYQELKIILDDDEYRAAMNSTITAFYTEPKIAEYMYKALLAFGFEGGKNRKIVEPSVGTGVFFSVLPEALLDTKLSGIELDSITGRIARKLYPNADIKIQGFETTKFDDNSIDVIIGNIPFNNIKVYDNRYEEENFLIHDYFIAKSLDILKPGGIAAIITSKGTMDKTDISAREYFAHRADLIGAIRLPNIAFKALSGTEVTADILFFKKLDRMRDNLDMELPDWVDTGRIPSEYLRINQYFLNNPEMILGEIKRDHRMYGRQDGTACIAPEGQDLYAELNNAIGKLSAQFSAEPDADIVTLQVKNGESSDEHDLKADAGTKNFTYVLKDNEIYYCEGGFLTKQELKGAKAERIKGLCNIRSALLLVVGIQSQESGYQESELKEAQVKLNEVYDAFTKKYGFINDKANSAIFNNDDQYPLLRSIEDLNKDNVTYSKSPIFTRATIKSYHQPTHADNAKEALEISLNMRLKVDIPYMAALCDKSEDEVIASLGERIYLNPNNYYGNPHEGWESAEEYLSGDVVAKLDYAKLKAIDNEMFSRNVTALQDVQPVKLLPSDIDFRIGSPWIPIEYYRQFMYETFETPEYLKPNKYGSSGRIELDYLEFTDAWRISNKMASHESVKAYSTYGSDRANAYEIYEDSLNMQSVTIRDRVDYYDKNGDEKTKYVINANETMIARSKQQQMKEAFGSWLFADKDRADTVLNLYNKRFNRIRPREYDGSHLRFDGMSEERELRKHQKDVIARIVYHGTCLMAHEVGAGKTAAMIAAGMYMKNMGVVKKPIYVVPNHLIEQWANEFMRFFPSANVLATTKADFEKKNRHRFISKIAMGEHDAIIIGHSQFEKIPVSKERQERMLTEEISNLTRIIEQMKVENGENWAVKQIVIFQNNLKDRLERLIKDERKDDLLNFEQLGVDYMFVDEAHVYKNCYTYTKMRNVAGIGQSKSQRASDMLMKCQYLQEVNKGRGITFATGTPISNSMSEMYVMQRFLQPDVLKKAGLSFFDKWAATFGDTISSLEINPEGSGYRIKNRFSKFHNLPELMKMFRIIADIKTGDMLNLPLPEIEGGKAKVIVTERSDFQTKVMLSFVDRAEKIRKREVDPEEDNFLKLTNEAKLMAIDPRLVYSDAPNDYDSKLNTCIRNIHDIWKETTDVRLTQVLFCDSGTPKPGQFNVYDEVKEQLIKLGVPEEEIAFVHDAKNDAQREAMFEKTRNGEIRILLGSTGKLGTGTNIQSKLYALHHLDVPWRPSDIIQRDGRGLRFGNENDVIKIFRYVTKDTFDAFLWQIQEQKLRYITQIMTSKSVSRSCEDTDETVLSAAEIKAIATSNPLLAEKMTVDNEVARLKLLKGNWTNERIVLERNISKFYPETIQKTKEQIENCKRDIAVLSNHKGGDFSIEVDGKRYNERPAAGEALLTVIRAKCEVGEGQSIVGKYRGLDLYAERKSLVEIDLRLIGDMRYTTPAGDSALGAITRIENLAERVPSFLSEAENKLNETQKQLEVARGAVKIPFEYEEKLSESLTRQSEINTELEFKELSKQQDEFLGGSGNGEDKEDEMEMEEEIDDEMEV